MVTSNLTNTEMIPALMGPVPASNEEKIRRRQRVLDLLDVAAPSAVVRRFKSRYQEYLRESLKR